MYFQNLYHPSYSFHHRCCYHYCRHHYSQFLYLTNLNEKICQYYYYYCQSLCRHQHHYYYRSCLIDKSWSPVSTCLLILEQTQLSSLVQKKDFLSWLFFGLYLERNFFCFPSKKSSNCCVVVYWLIGPDFQI